jgi:hypothetical protein
MEYKLENQVQKKKGNDNKEQSWKLPENMRFCGRSSCIHI